MYMLERIGIDATHTTLGIKNKVYADSTVMNVMRRIRIVEIDNIKTFIELTKPVI